MFTALRASRPTRTTRRAALGLQELGTRVVPAVVLTSLDLDSDGVADDIRIVGDAGNNIVGIIDNGASTAHVTIDANGDGDTTDQGDLDQTFTFTGDAFVVEARLAGGNDKFAYATTTNFDQSARTVSVDLGAGADSFVWNIGTRDVLNHSRIALDVTGGGGADYGLIRFAGVNNSAVNVRTDWGAGGDTYNMGFGLIDGGAAAEVATDLGGGANLHDAEFAGVGKFDVGTLDVAIVGGPQVDTVVVHMTDDVGAGQAQVSRAGITADLGAGNDRFTVGFKAGEFLVDNASQVTVAARGGLGNDTLRAVLDGTSAFAARVDENALFAIALDGGAGNDAVAVEFGATDAWQIKAGGTMQLRLDGAAGTDTINCLLRNTASTVAGYDVAVRGGSGNDTAVFSLANPGGMLDFGPAGGIVLDGGTGTDKLTDLTPGFALKANFETVQ